MCEKRYVTSVLCSFAEYFSVSLCLSLSLSWIDISLYLRPSLSLPNAAISVPAHHRDSVHEQAVQRRANDGRARRRALDRLVVDVILCVVVGRVDVADGGAPQALAVSRQGAAVLHFLFVLVFGAAALVCVM